MIYITSDTHRELDIKKINPDDLFTAGKSLSNKDYVLICGDFGCLWDGKDGDLFWIHWLSSLPWTTLFIDGNHENFDVLNTYPEEEWNGGSIHRIDHNIIHLKRGQVFTIEDKKIFTFGGAFSHDYEYRVEHATWWKDELPTITEVNESFKVLENNDWKVDYIISHDIYKSHSLYKKFENLTMTPYTDEYVDVRDVLETIRKKTDYKIWFNGHYHVDMVEYTEDKPCITLFDKVIPIENIEQMKKHFE